MLGIQESVCCESCCPGDERAEKGRAEAREMRYANLDYVAKADLRSFRLTSCDENHGLQVCGFLPVHP